MVKMTKKNLYEDCIYFIFSFIFLKVDSTHLYESHIQKYMQSSCKDYFVIFTIQSTNLIMFYMYSLYSLIGTNACARCRCFQEPRNHMQPSHHPEP